ncbi:hypothetical protein MAR_021408, partial [Mya arenaria]
MVRTVYVLLSKRPRNQRDLTVGREYVAQRVSEVTKNHQGASKEIIVKDVRMYATGTQSCPVRSFNLYTSKRNLECSAFILPKAMLLIPLIRCCLRKYTNHCIRATAITALSHAGFKARHIMTISGHRNESSVRSYVTDTTPQQKRVMSGTLSNFLPHSNYSEFDDGINDALCLSASQTERILEDKTHYEYYSGACASNAVKNKQNEIEKLQAKNVILP